MANWKRDVNSKFDTASVVNQASSPEVIKVNYDSTLESLQAVIDALVARLEALESA